MNVHDLSDAVTVKLLQGRCNTHCACLVVGGITSYGAPADVDYLSFYSLPIMFYVMLKSRCIERQGQILTPIYRQWPHTIE